MTRMTTINFAGAAVPAAGLPALFPRRAGGPVSEPLRLFAADGGNCGCGGGKPADEDADMKIAGCEKSGPKPDEEAARAAGELEKQRRNGNIGRARDLGAKLAEILLDRGGEAKFGIDESEDEKSRMQRRILLAFAIQSAVREAVSGAVLQGVVLGAFNDALKEKAPGFFRDAEESGSFSFYTLCLRRGGDVGRCVGGTFAMLVGSEGNDVLRELGESLYLHYMDVTRRAVSEAGFQ